MKESLDRLISIAKEVSPKAFINHNNELIVVPSRNIYFRLEDVENEMDLKCKVISWLSRPSCKGVSNYWQKRVREIFNRFLGTNFNRVEMEVVYTYLGNNVNRALCEKFIESRYDITVIDKEDLLNRITA